MDNTARLSKNPADFRYFVRGPCRWYTGCGWQQGHITKVGKDYVIVTASAGSKQRTIVVRDARNITRDTNKN